MPDEPIAIVTGVGPGTGSAIVRRFAADFALSPWDRIRALEQELTDTHAMICDASSESQVAEVVAHVRNRYGSPNVLIHNAVGGGWGTFLEVEPKMLDRNFQVNVMGLLYLAREVALGMIKAASGTILVTGIRRQFAARRTRRGHDSASVVGMLTVSSLVRGGIVARNAHAEIFRSGCGEAGMRREPLC